MDKATLDREQPWRNSGATVSGNSSRPPHPDDAVVKRAHSLCDVAHFQHALHGSVHNLSIRLSNIVGMLNGQQSSDENCSVVEAPEESAPIDAIITRIHNTQAFVNMCAELTNIIEVRMGIA